MSQSLLHQYFCCSRGWRYLHGLWGLVFLGHSSLAGQDLLAAWLLLGLRGLPLLSSGRRRLRAELPIAGPAALALAEALRLNEGLQPCQGHVSLRSWKRSSLFSAEILDGLKAGNARAGLPENDRRLRQQLRSCLHSSQDGLELLLQIKQAGDLACNSWPVRSLNAALCAPLRLPCLNLRSIDM